MWSIVKPAATAVKSFLPGKVGDRARADVKATTRDFRANYHGPGAAPLRVANSLVGPPQSRLEAGLALGLSALPLAKPAAAATRGTTMIGSNALARFGARLTGRTAAKTATRKAVPAVASSAAKKAAIVGAGAAGIAFFGDDIGHGVGSLVGNSVAGAGEGLGDAVSGAGEGLGDALRDALDGLADGAKKLILPGLLVAGGLVAFVLVKNRVPARRSS